MHTVYTLLKYPEQQALWSTQVILCNCTICNEHTQLTMHYTLFMRNTAFNGFLKIH